MKKKHLLMLVVLLFSFIAETLPPLVPAHAETTKTELIDEKFLKVSYEYESQEDSNRWRVRFSRQSEESDKEQRLKLKVTEEKGNVITYPNIKDMIEKDEWLIETNYSSAMEGQLSFELPKSVQKLYLDVQMDEQALSTKQDAKIQENILDLKEPFVLKIKETKAETAASESKPTLKTSSAELIGPPEPDAVVPVPASAVPANGLLRMDPPKYTNKMPSYTSNTNGVYPTNSWTPTGQSNVKNHQGGYEGESGWDGLTEWNISPDNYTNSYIKYGENKSNPNIALRKYASETSKNDEFDVRLNVRGSTIPKPGVDVCFVLDNSYSMIDPNLNISGMNRKTLAVNSLQKLIDKFKAANPDPNSLRIGGVVYSASNNPNGNPTVSMSNNAAGWQNLVDTYRNTRSDGDTYTQKALMDAQTMLNNIGGTNRRKVIFLLTDGAPNMSAVPIELRNDSSIYYDGVRFTQYDGASLNRGSYMQPDVSGRVHTVKIPNGYYILRPNRSIYSHLTPVNSTAADIKEQGIEINSIAINISKNYSYEGHSTEELITGLYRIASKKANATGDLQRDYQFYHANSSGDFDISFDDWFDSVIQTVDKGVIEDPIGEMYELVGQPTVKEIRKSGVPAIESSKLPNAPVVSNNKITVNNINLYGNQEIQVDYKLRLKTNHANYEGNKWYPTNGKTTLIPTPERTTDVLDFGVPSARGKVDKFTIPVEKIWSDTQRSTANYWGLRNGSVQVVLQRRSGSSWVDVETKTLSSANSWKGTFQAVEGGTNVYRVVEPSRTTGYAKPTSNTGEFTAATLPSKGVQITNALLTGTAIINKYKEDGKTPFTTDLPKFTVRRRSDGRILATNLEPNANGQVTIPNIPLGDFIVEETYVPRGYKKMDDIELRAVENSGGTGLVITLNGQASPYKVTNKLAADLEIPVEKVWSDKYQATDNYWGLRSGYVRVNLQQKNGSTWQTIESKVLTTIDSWKGVFSAVEGGSNLYRVVEETRVPGYAKPTYNYSTEFTAATVPNGGIKLTNKLLTGSITFYKYKDDGKTPFSSDHPKFTVKRKSDGKVLATNLTPNASGAVIISDIPMGEFIVEESYVPKGYEKMADMELKAVENNAGTGLNITLDGQNSPKVTNKLADFVLWIKKVDQDGKDLRGASFRLRGVGYDETKENGPYFEFTNLRPGEYSLTETVVPSEYEGMNGTVRISISQTGEVTIQSHPNVSGSGELGNPNRIQLTVTNKKRRAGALPSTGGSGLETIFKVAIGVISTAGGLLGSLYWLHTKRRGS
ncbi:SpaA isopeptide-forming pilin-related protein [Enterococcus pseudoavium]|uniref:SpaA isopeptide-forming pilin-related protein n=1 Tax=Enterococcus pseudoavium TaxID=44007 RepID=A0AAE4KXH7_9ENTE|nr:SpaA isopeptide-forming pilin-related protein [Enterococcus pseudoavium]MDT2737855.1 SpaA isopeptide-forming pilin-related protein [Enterococcus pseudoavium]